MAILLSSYSVALLSAATVAYILRAVYLYVSFKILARRSGCQPAHVRPCRLPLGIDNLTRTIRSVLDNTLQNDDILIWREMGCPGTWQQNILGTYYLATADPENIKAMLATQFDDFELGTLRMDQLGPLIGHGIFTSDGKDWHQQRAMLRPQFTRSQISNLTLLECHVQNLFRHLDNVPAGEWTSETDLAPLFFNLTLDSATEFLFGQSVESQVDALGAKRKTAQEEKSDIGGSKDWSSFGRAFDRANKTIALRGMLMNLYFLYTPRSFARDCKEVQEFADYFVQRALHRQQQQQQQQQPETTPAETTAYVFLDELAKTTRDPAVLRSQLLNILLAGRDTTAGLLGWTLFLLARHPAYYASLHRVIVDTFGPYSSDTTAAATITFESLKACRPLQHLLREVLRLHPVVPENGRRAVRDTTLPRGGGPDGQAPVLVRRGEDVLYSVNVMHHRHDLWGDDADMFVPQRWEGRKHGWEYLPFNGGPRVCLGQQFALTEAAYVVVRMVQRYAALESKETDGTTRHQYTLTTAPLLLKPNSLKIANEVKNYFLAPSWDYSPLCKPSGTIALWNILSDPKRAVPPLAGATATPDASVTCQTIKAGYEWTREEHKEKKFGVWTKFLDMIAGIGLDFGHKRAKSDYDLITFEALITKEAYPTEEYLRDMVRRVEVRRYLERFEFKRPIYVVVGTKEVYGANLKRIVSKDRGTYMGVSADLTMTGAPVSLGPEARTANSASDETSFKDSSPFVFALRLRKLVIDPELNIVEQDDADGGMLGLDSDDVKDIIIQGLEQVDSMEAGGRQEMVYDDGEQVSVTFPK